jgi:hypothetical protein
LGIDENIEIGKSKVKTLHVPCHTKGHTIYSFLPLEDTEEDHISCPDGSLTIEGKKIRVFDS